MSSLSAEASKVQTRVLKIGLAGGICSGKSTIVRLLQSELLQTHCSNTHFSHLVTVNADILGHICYDPTTTKGKKCISEIVDRFGEGVQDENGGIARRNLGAIVFKSKAAMDALSKIVWPYIRSSFLTIMEETEKMFTENNGKIVEDTLLQNLHEYKKAIGVYFREHGKASIYFPDNTSHKNKEEISGAGSLPLVNNHHGLPKTCVIVVEAAVLFKAGWEPDFDVPICICVPYKMALQRIMGRDNCDIELATKKLDSQESNITRIGKKPLVIWNVFGDYKGKIKESLLLTSSKEASKSSDSLAEAQVKEPKSVAGKSSIVQSGLPESYQSDLNEPLVNILHEIYHAYHQKYTEKDGTGKNGSEKNDSEKGDISKVKGDTGVVSFEHQRIYLRHSLPDTASRQSLFNQWTKTVYLGIREGMWGDNNTLQVLEESHLEILSYIHRTFDLLVALYSEQHRRYHTLTHLQSVLAFYEEQKTNLEDPTAVALAIFFHDVIYCCPQPCKGYNEYRSAQMFRKFSNAMSALLTPSDKLRSSRQQANQRTNHTSTSTLTKEVSATERTVTDSTRVERIAKWIEITANHFAIPEGTPITNDLKLFLDFDLSVLGTESWTTYEKYMNGVKYEYSYMAPKKFRTGRLKFLETMLKKEGQLYYSEWGQDQFEVKAKENMSKEVEYLLNQNR
eukprot:g474.t1